MFKEKQIYLWLVLHRHSLRGSEETVPVAASDREQAVGEEEEELTFHSSFVPF